jgi:hypothetical protein
MSWCFSLWFQTRSPPIWFLASYRYATRCFKLRGRISDRRTKFYSDIRYIVGLGTLQSNIGRSDIRLSSISMIMDIGLSAHLWKEDYYRQSRALAAMKRWNDEAIKQWNDEAMKRWSDAMKHSLLALNASSLKFLQFFALINIITSSFSEFVSIAWTL